MSRDTRNFRRVLRVFLHLTGFPVTATRIFLTLNVVFARAHQRFHAGLPFHLYMYLGEKNRWNREKFFYSL